MSSTADDFLGQAPLPSVAPRAAGLLRKLRKRYPLDIARRDLLAALTVAAISLPQGMAYALIAGVDPRYGLYSAIVVTLVASLLGSSSHLINGPTSAISLVVFSALAFIDPEARVEAAEAMFLLGVMVGVIQIAIAVFRLGDLTRYISESVILGFMCGASLLLALGQIGNALGVREKGTGHQHVLHRLWLTLTQGDAINLKALSLSAAAVVLALVLRRLVRRFRLPQLDMFVVMLLLAIGAWWAGWSVPGAGGKTAVSVVGAVPASLPSFHIADIQWDWIVQMSSSALAIAFLGLLEALSIAKAIAHETRQPLDYNRQCLAEGVANLVGGFFRCLPGSGSLSRSAINYQAGAATRFSGVVTAAIVAIAVLLLAPLTRYIPKPVLAGLLLVTAVRLINFDRLRYTVRASRYDAALVAITFLAALLIGVEFAIIVGVLLSVLLFVPRAAKLRATELVVSEEGVVRERVASDPAAAPVLLYDLEGELFFGAAPELERHLADIRRRVRDGQIQVVVLRLKRVRNPDVVCLERLENFLGEAGRDGLVVLLAGVRPEFGAALQRLRIGSVLAADRIHPEVDDVDSSTVKAVRQAYGLVGDSPDASSPAWARYYLV